MNPSNALSINEAFIEGIFEEAGINEQPAINQNRVEQVLARALHESLIADTSSFLFKGMPAAAEGLIALANKNVGKNDIDYRA